MQEAFGELLEGKLKKLQAEVDDLLLKHSSLYEWNPRGSGLITLANYAWKELADDARRLQARLLEEYRRYQALLSVMTKHQPAATLSNLSDSHESILSSIDQSDRTWLSNIGEARSHCEDAFKTQLRVLQALLGEREEEVLMVPDTNALLYNTRLDTWQFSDIKEFRIILLPTVLQELDTLKMTHRSDAVREKSETLIRQFKGYRTRGRLTEGVPLVRGKSVVQAVATEPRIQESLPWLDPTNADDRILSAFIEVIRARPAHPAFLITRDINLQNKAEFAGLPFGEPPEPLAPEGEAAT